MTADRAYGPGKERVGTSDAANVLIVCTGNVCRSAFVERYLRARLDPGAITVSSAGTGALVGAPMDGRTAERAQSAGAGVDGFTSRQLTADMLDDTDLVLTATRQHRAAVVTLAPKTLRHCFTVREFAALVAAADATADAPETSPSRRIQHVVAAAAARRGFVPPLSDEDADIVDPYRQPDEVYDLMEQQILSAMPPIVRALAG